MALPDTAPVLVQAAYEVARALQLPWLARRIAGGAVVLCYHNVIRERPPLPHDAGLHMDIARFERQMAWVRRHLEPVSLAALIECLRQRRATRNLVAVTFDDGYAGFFRHAVPILRTFSIPATVFLVSDAADHGRPFWWDHPYLVSRATGARREHWLTVAQGLSERILELEQVAEPPGLRDDLLPASWETIRASLGADLHVGAHTRRHPALPALSATALRSELTDGAARIEQQLGIRPRWLAYPYGAWNTAVRHAVQAAGYEAALTLDAKRIGTATDDLFALPRINVPGRIPSAAFEAWVSGLLPPRARR